MGWKFQPQSMCFLPDSFHLRLDGRCPSFPLFPPVSLSSLQMLKPIQNPNLIPFLINAIPSSNFLIPTKFSNSTFLLLFLFRHFLIVSSLPLMIPSRDISERRSPINSIVSEIPNNASSIRFNKLPFALHSSLRSLETAVCTRNLRPNSRILSCSPFSSYLHLRSFSNSSSSENRGNKRNCNSHLQRVNVDEFAEMVELIKIGGDDMERTLNKMNPMPVSVDYVSKTLSVLNDRGIPALHFFSWLRKTHPTFSPSPEIYNQMISNIGYAEDYHSMLRLLTELSPVRHCLTEKAFGFLKVFSRDPAQIGRSVERIVETLSSIKGSCCSSGTYALIKMLCALNFFDLATYVMEVTARKTSYYHILIAAKCRNGKFQEARELFDEMRKFGCDPNTKSYNYLLGSLSKNGKIAEACELLEIMESLGYLPDSVTFEIIAFHACRLGRMDFAIEILYQMFSIGLKPRNTTHSAFIKGYFWSQRTRDAHKYVLEMSDKDKHSSNMNYSLLASLFQKSGRAVEASEILVEMMKKGLKPNFPVYMRVTKDLYKMRKGDMIADLKFRFSKFHSVKEDG